MSCNVVCRILEKSKVSAKRKDETRTYPVLLPIYCLLPSRPYLIGTSISISLDACVNAIWFKA